MFQQTATGYVATAETIAFWNARDTCPDPSCGAVVSPTGETPDGQRFTYRCPCDPAEPYEWTRGK